MTDDTAGVGEVQAPTPLPIPNETKALVPVPTTDLELTPPADDAEWPRHSDPFPHEAWATLTSHAAGYLRLTVALVRDPAVSKHRRAALLAAAAYFASPIDLIPGIIPVLGQVDDLAVAMLAIRLALNALEPARRQTHLATAGLSDEALREDLVAAGRIAAWAARAGIRTGFRVGRGAIRVTVQGGRAAAELAVRRGRAAARRAAPALDQTSATVGQVGSSAANLASGAAGRATSARRRLTDRVRRREAAETAPAEPGSSGEAPDLAAPGEDDLHQD